MFSLDCLVCAFRYQSKTAKAILDCVLNIQPKDVGGGSGETRESIVYKLSDDMLSKLPPDYVPFEVRARLQAMGAYQPMNIFLRQELDRIQRVLTAVSLSFVIHFFTIEQFDGLTTEFCAFSGS